MPDVTDEELRKEIEKILKNADLAKTSTKKVIQKLEEIFDVELAARKKTIDQMVLDYVNSQESEDENEDDEEEEEEEEEKKPPKRSAARGKTSSSVGRRTAKKSRTATSDEEEDDDSNDSEYEEKKPKPKSKKGGGGGGGRGKGGGYTRAYKLSPALAELMGTDKMPRHEVVKRMWAIIRERELYDPSNKQFAICDDALYKVIGTKRFRAFGMMKYLKAHFLDD